MAQFKQLTQVDGDETYINLDNVCQIHQYPGVTTITFAKQHGIDVKETAQEILRDLHHRA